MSNYQRAGLSLLIAVIISALSFLNRSHAYQYRDLPRESLKRPVKELKLKEVGVKTATGYSSTPDQTHGDPFRTASGKKVAKDRVAYNCLPFGTRLLIEGRIYEVADRLAKKYKCNRIDFWFMTRTEALQFGVKRLKVYKIIID